MSEDRQEGVGPVPVRDLMKRMSPMPEAEGEPRWEGVERTFEVAGEEWVVRTAGASAYGTGERGRARLVAVHFFRESEPELPVREALVGAGRFGALRPEELRSLWERATPIDLDRD